MNRKTAAYLTPYREAVEKFGTGFDATLWSTPEAQQRRFAVLADMLPMQGRTVVDAGCGPGDLAVFLRRKRIRFKRYIGIDGVEKIVHAAAARKLPKCEFRQADLVRHAGIIGEYEPDVVVFSGTLNTMTEQTARTLLGHAFDVAQVGVVFNFLSNRPHPRFREQKLGPAKRFNTIRMLDWALSQSPWVSFRQDYFDGHDAAIAITKKRD